MNNTFVIIAAVIIGPLLLSWLNSRQRKAEKVEDYARQDAVAAQAAEAAALLAERQDAVANQAAEAARLLLASNKEIAAAAKQAELDATVDQVVLMREVMSLKQVAGIRPSNEAIALIAAKELKIADLQATLNDRRLTHETGVGEAD